MVQGRGSHYRYSSISDLTPQYLGTYLDPLGLLPELSKVATSLVLRAGVGNWCKLNVCFLNVSSGQYYWLAKRKWILY